MGKKRKKRKKRRRHPQSPLQPRSPHLEEILNRAQTLQEEGKLEQAVEVLEDTPAHIQRRIEVQLPLGALYMMLGDLRAAAEAFERAERLEPDNPFTAFFLAGAYFQLDWWGYAIRAIRRALHRRDILPDDMLRQAETLLEDVEAFIQQAAAEVGISAEIMEEAFRHSERGERLVNEERFEEAALAFQEAARLVPTWHGPRNNEALFRFFSGEVEKAISICEEVLTEEADNIHALSNLVRFYTATEEREKAEAYARRIRELPLENHFEVSKAVEALGILGDDEGLYAIYRRSRSLLDELDDTALLALGSAAANLGHPRTARRLWRRAEAVGVLPEATARLFGALQNNAPGPGLAQRYPTAILPTLITWQRLEEFGKLLKDWGEGRIDDERAQKRMKSLVARTPHIVQVAAKLLWENNPQVGMEALGLIGTPAALAEIERFAFSQAGPMELRVQAIHILTDLGHLDLSQPIEIWNEETQEWHPLRLARWTVTSEIEPPPYSPEVWELIDVGTEALGKGQLNLAREKLEAAIALDPQAVVAHHNLAVALERQGNKAAALEHLHRALEIDPTYVFARCALARYHLSVDDPEAAQETLDPILERSVLTPAEVRYYQLTLAEIAISQEDYDSARRCVEMVLELLPDDESAQETLMRIALLESGYSPYWEEHLARQRRREEKKRHRPTRPDAGLVECLGRLTKDALIGTARAMPIPRKYNVRKAILIQDLAEYLTNPEELREIVQDLSDEEQQSLREVLEAGGTMDWEGFTARYGDDLDESPYWQWHEPETVMGRLRMLGLLSEGTVDDRLIILVPRELRDLLPPLL